MMEIEFMQKQYLPVAGFPTKDHPVYGNAEFALLEDEFECLFLVVKTESGRWTIVSWWPAEAIALIQKMPKVKVG